MSIDLLDELRALIQRDVNNRGLARDPHDNLFTRCRCDFANACRSIAQTPQPVLAIVTGFFIPHAQSPCGETDGPLGALFLARAGQIMGIKVIFITDTFCRRALEIGLEASGLSSLTPVLLANGRRQPDGEFDQPADAGRSPTHLIALERVGPGGDGRCRNMHGRDVSAEMSPAHLLFENAADEQTTIGIGDGGNEIGMGKIPPQAIARNISNGERIACRVPTDHLIVAGVSNWGAYALAAGVAALRHCHLPASLFDVERERELLRVMVEQGPLVDGVSGRQTVSVDGLAFDDYAQPLRQIGELLESWQWLI